MRHFFLSILFALPLVAAPENLLRNGNFEGGLLYWHQIDPHDHTLVKDAAVGEYALRIAKGNVMSAPFVAERGAMMTVSFFVKGEKSGRVGVQMPPSAREPGTKAKRLWVAEAEQSAEIGNTWKRVSFTWAADVPADGFWPNPHYLVQIGGYDQPILIDGVTVTAGKDGTPEYVPRRSIEVVADCANLPGWNGAAGNAFDKGATARMIAHVSNPGKAACTFTLRWQLVDYEGVAAVGSAMDSKITLLAGKTLSAETSIALIRNGLVYARLTALDDKGAVIDTSDFPLTSLPYPKAATKPDYRERFGGSFAGGEMMLEKFQRIGFGWTRWYPETKWHNFQPRKDAPFNWHQETFDLAAKHGVSEHVVLYGWPEGLMDNEHSGQPLPLDMQWKADDPRWDDLSIETAWDRYVKAAVANFHGQSIIFEISNEPEFDKWDQLHAEYAKFTIRTAKLIRATDPHAKIMVNNVYGIPSPVNAAFFTAGGLKYIDVVSWHDYHEGWLSDAQGIKRMRQNMDEAGGKNVEIWFNEGWAYTNTAVDEPIACTHLTASESANAQAASVAEMSIAGQKKTILFHTGYEDHGQSFWDYSGPGTLLWDWYGYPLPLVAMWNVYNHHIGISEEVGFVRPPGANFTIFQDVRNGKGVMIAYADRDSKSDVTVALPDFGAPVVAEDIMGNAAAAAHTLVLSKTGRPVILYTASKAPGSIFLAKLEPLDRKHAGFVYGADGDFRLPSVWEGNEKGSSDGSIAMAGGKPVWKLEQLWPADWKNRENFKPMIWKGTGWSAKEGEFGGQPGAQMKDGVLDFGTRAPHGPDNDRHLRTAGLSFVAPKGGSYSLHGSAECRMWDSNNKTTLHLLKKSATRMEKVADFPIENGAKASLEAKSVILAAGEELTLLPEIDGMFAGGDCLLRDLSISFGSTKTASGYRLPAAWKGTEKGSAKGNPVSAGDKPVWRLDQVWPDDPVMASNYVPLRWSGAEWAPLANGAGGQPAVFIESGDIDFAVRGSWTGNEGQRIAGLAFIAPADGSYHVTGKASSKPWEGGARKFKLGIFKKDTQRCASQCVIDMPRSGEPVDIDLRVDLTAGHELVLLPLMPDWHNAAHIRISGLTVEQAEP